MALSGSLQLSHDLGLCRNQRRSKQLKCVISRGNLHLLNGTFPSRTTFKQQDSWRVLLSDRIHRPISSIPHRRNVFRCHSSAVPGKAFGLKAVKAASLALTRCYNVLQGFPIIFKLVPAVGLVVFSIWGVVPLIRKGRDLVVNRNDSNWKNSSTYFVMTSYVQPLLLWTGALFICRALDPIALPTEASEVVKNRLLNFVRSLSTVLAFAYCLSSVIQQTQKFFTERSDPGDARNMGFQFAGRAVYSAVWVASISLFMELLGFSTQKWLTAGGLGTVLLTLAGREIFTNFLSSIMIHATRPFVVNEWIQTKIEGYDVSGTVEHVGWWSPTIIRGEDREAVHIPNHQFTVNIVRNLSQKTHWRIKTHLGISHLDVNKINSIVADMRKVLAKNPQVEQQRLHRRVFLDNINPENQALMVLVSCFVKTSHFEEYLCVKEGIMLDLLRVISHHRARLATPIRTVQKIYTDPDLDNVPFAGSVYNASKRPLLLIEPNYRINGEEKAKPQSRPSRDQDSKISSKPVPETKADSKVGATPKSEPKSKESSAADSKGNSNTGELINTETKELSTPSKAGDEVTVKSTPKSPPIAHSKVKGTSSLDPVPDNLTKTRINSSNKQLKVENLANEGSETSGGRNEQPSISRSSLEENIVLGVALDGSKRTLPIDEEIESTPPSPTADAKELTAACRNGNGSSPGDKDKKDGQIQATPNTSSDQ